MFCFLFFFQNYIIDNNLLEMDSIYIPFNADKHWFGALVVASVPGEKLKKGMTVSMLDSHALGRRNRINLYSKFTRRLMHHTVKRIYGVEGTRELRKSLGYESITEIFAKRNSRFLNGISRTGKSVLIQLKLLSLS